MHLQRLRCHSKTQIPTIKDYELALQPNIAIDRHPDTGIALDTTEAGAGFRGRRVVDEFSWDD